MGTCNTTRSTGNDGAVTGFLRAGVSLLLAGAVTLGLFHLMTRLILAPPALAETGTLPVIIFGALPELSPVKPKPPLQPPEIAQPLEPPAVPAPLPAPDSPAPDRTVPALDFAITGLTTGLPGPGGPTGPVQGLVPRAVLQPRYPHAAQLAGQEGWVRVRFEIAPDGQVLRAWVVAAEPDRVFDRAVLESVRKWRFQPTGQAEVMVGEQVIDFRLDREGA